MIKNHTLPIIILYSFTLALIGILSIYFASKIMISIKIVEANLIFNAPIAVLLSIILFSVWEFILSKVDKELYLVNINLMVVANLFSLFIVVFTLVVFASRYDEPHILLWKAFEYLYILIPINFILIFFKKYMLSRRGLNG